MQRDRGKVIYCYLVKWPVFPLQRDSAKSSIAPSNFSPLCNSKGCLSDTTFSTLLDPRLFCPVCTRFCSVSRVSHTCGTHRKQNRNTLGHSTYTYSLLNLIIKLDQKISWLTYIASFPQENLKMTEPKTKVIWVHYLEK